MYNSGTPTYSHRPNPPTRTSTSYGMDGSMEGDTSLKVVDTDLLTGARGSTSQFCQESRVKIDRNPFSPQHVSNRPVDKSETPYFKSDQYSLDPFKLFSSPVPTHSSPMNTQARSIPSIPGMIGTIPTFSADTDNGESVENFFSMLERSSRCALWDDDTKTSVLISKLRGRALKTFNEGIGLIEDVQYNEIKLHLLNLYRPKESRAEKTDRFLRMTQRIDESVEAFYFRLRGLSSGLAYSPTVIEEVLRERFIDGIRPEIAKEVMLRNPTDIYDVLDKAKRFEDIEMRLGKRSKKIASVIPEDPRDKTIALMREEMNQMKTIMMEMGDTLKHLNLREKTTPKVIICESCTNSGHTASRCPNNDQTNLN